MQSCQSKLCDWCWISNSNNVSNALYKIVAMHLHLAVLKEIIKYDSVKQNKKESLNKYFFYNSKLNSAEKKKKNIVSLTH